MNLRLWTILLESFPQILLQGIKVTIPLTAVSFLFALLISVIVAMIQYADVPVLKQLCRFYIWIIRGTPLLVQMYVVFYGLPSVGLFLDAWTSAIIVLSFNEGAYMAETVRGALESIPVGQVEAGQCVGLSYLQIMWYIVLPQAFKVAFPALSNSLIGLLKETSLATTITITEMIRQAQIINSRYYETLGLYCEVALIYLAFCTILTWVQRAAEKRLSRVGGKDTDD
ncbi:MAG: amino acid ABC transporter permease [Oscillospiraceae bacterium]|nr:amino acid ABC transporter permease [Oscillospiraceae bacterium]MBR2740027.1 amino acid ABC transporter permease [Oscillospiraceae bacterium]